MVRASKPPTLRRGDQTFTACPALPVRLDFSRDIIYGPDGRGAMVLRFIAVFTVALAWMSPRAEAGLSSRPGCCGCAADSGSGPTLFCARTTEENNESVSDQCAAAGGLLICKVVVLGEACTFEGLGCPASAAPVLDAAPLGALVVSLAGLGVVTARRRARRL